MSRRTILDASTLEIVPTQSPNGYSIGINEWCDAEHDAWLKGLESKRAAGLIP